MATVNAFLDVLRRHVGTTENPPDSDQNPFSAALGRPAQFWCADFVVACARDVGLALPSESAYTPTLADGFRRAGRWFSTDPQPGDLAFIDFPRDNKTRIQHVAVVVAVEGDRLRTIEGNTSSGERGSQDNGGGVFARVRSRNIVVGFGRPAFEGAPPTLGQGIIVPKEEEEMAVVIARSQGGYIVVQPDGGVFAYDGAPFKGSIPENPDIKLGGNVVGGAWSESGEGYWLVARDWAVYGFGDAGYLGGFNTEPPEVRGARYAVGLVRTGKASYRIVTFDPSGDETRYDTYEYFG